MSLEIQSRAILSKVQKNLNFAIARGLTNTAKFASQKMEQQLPTIFDRPTPFTRRAIGFQPATKAKLEARVFVRDQQAMYLMRQEQGGLRTPQPGSPINIAVGQRLNQYGNIAKGSIAKTKARPKVFTATGKGNAKHLPLGIYERVKGKGRKKPGKLKLLVAFRKQAAYSPRFRFVQRVTGIARDNVKREIETSIAQAMATMR